jgi:methionyl-tRNA synthetase
MNNKIVVTAGLPYANGKLHIGHMLEYVQADIYTKALKLLGKEAIFVCGSDMHGTPIEVNAQKAGKTPQEFANFHREGQLVDFKKYLIDFDSYSHTDTSENKEMAIHFFNTLKEKGLIYTKKIPTIYCQHCQRSLPDRFVKGTCPHCQTEGQYGDICESCGKVLKGVDLINPVCTICGHKPEHSESVHYFFKLSDYADKLKEWVKGADWMQSELKNWLKNWLENLDDWCISRDEPYYGFAIPNSAEECGQKKYFYVWLDAPIGYITSTIQYDKNWEEYWKGGQVQHIIGKDIAYFHFLFWPAMLMAMDIPVPELTVHGFITVNGKKMSKSRGTFFTAEELLDYFSPEHVRFYYASHLNRKVTDVDLNLEEFKAEINNVLVGNLSNFCYRVLKFAQTNYGEIVDVQDEPLEQFIDLVDQIKQNYLNFDFKNVIKSILQLADIGNAYFQNSEVWKDKDSDESKAKVGYCVNLAKNLAILVKPILPLFAEKVFSAFGEKELTWDDLNFNWTGKLNEPEMLIEKIDKIPETKNFPLQLTVGKIVSLENHPDADKLYVLKVNFGDEERQILAGLRPYLEPEQLLNKFAVFCKNMKPAKIRGLESRGMILAAEDEDHKVAILDVEGLEPGQEVNFGDLKNNNQEITFNDFEKVKMVVNNGKVEYCGQFLNNVQVKGVKSGACVE